MKAPGNFNDISQRVNLYLDKALNEEDASLLLREVDDDPRYRGVLNREQDFRTFIKNNVRRTSCSPDLIKSIKDKISYEGVEGRL